MREGWSSTALKNVCTVDKAKHSGTTLPYVGLEHIESGTGKFIGSLAPAMVKSTTFSFTASHVLYGRLRPYLNKVLLPEFDGHCSSEIFPLRVESSLDRRFLYYWLTWEPVVKEIDSTSTGARMPRANINKLLEFELPLPSLPEQKRIVAILDEAFAGIATAVANTEKNLANARELLDRFVRMALSPQDDAWEAKRLSEVCTLSSGGTPSKQNKNYWNGEIPWISGRDMKSTRLYDSALHISEDAVRESSTRLAPAGTVLILVRGMGLAHGAQLGELMSPCAFNQDIRGIHTGANLVPRYLLFALRERINHSDKVLSSAAHGTLKLDTSELLKLVIPIPPLAEQKRIVSIVDSMSEETRRLKWIYLQKLDALVALKQALLQKAFSGELTAKPQQEIETALA